jgi:hypothetical protein
MPEAAWRATGQGTTCLALKQMLPPLIQQLHPFAILFTLRQYEIELDLDSPR